MPFITFGSHQFRKYACSSGCLKTKTCKSVKLSLRFMHVYAVICFFFVYAIQHFSVSKMRVALIQDLQDTQFVWTRAKKLTIILGGLLRRFMARLWNSCKNKMHSMTYKMVNFQCKILNCELGTIVYSVVQPGSSNKKRNSCRKKNDDLKIQIIHTVDQFLHGRHIVKSMVGICMVHIRCSKHNENC